MMSAVLPPFGDSTAWTLRRAGTHPGKITDSVCLTSENAIIRFGWATAVQERPSPFDFTCVMPRSRLRLLPELAR